MDGLFRKAAKSALYEWGREDGLEDLVSELWVWYLERPSVQYKLKESDKFLARDLVKNKQSTSSQKQLMPTTCLINVTSSRRTM